MFEGWFAGDGYRGQRTNVGSTISRKLAVQMFQIASRLGLCPALRRSEPVQNRHAKTRQPRYEISFPKGEPTENYRRHENEDCVWRKVRLLAFEDFSGPVFNLHVHGDESYVADGIGVHNCTGNGTVGAANLKQNQQFGTDGSVLLSTISVYKQVGRNADSGATIEQVCKAISTVGALPLDTPENRAEFGSMVMPATGFSTRFPDGWKESASLFVASNVLPIRTCAGIKTALVKGDPVVVGRQGHCVYYTDLLWNASKAKFEAPYANSWGKWGAPFAHMEYGFGRDSESYMKESSYFAFAIRTMVVRVLKPAA